VSKNMQTTQFDKGASPAKDKHYYWCGRRFQSSFRRKVLYKTFRAITGLSLSSIFAVNAYPLYAYAQAPVPLNPASTPSLDVETGITQRGEDDYRLGARDEIRIDIFNVPEFSGPDGTYTLPVDGQLNLPWIGRVSLSGMTLSEAEALLTSRYAPFINNPLISVTLLSARSLRISVVGEVNRPGPYTLTPGEGGALAVGADLVEIGGNVNDWPTVVQAIQTAGGITQSADIRNVEVRRVLGDGSEKIANINLWDILQTGDPDLDITLRAGDTIIVPTATELSFEESQELAVASFSPDSIRVNVVGEVDSPGELALTPNSSLNQALLAAGGFDHPRARTGRVTLVRLNPDGTVMNRDLRVDFTAGLNDENNPTLRNNDIVLVSRSGITRASDFLGAIGTLVNTVINPVRGVVDIIDRFDDFRDRRDRRRIENND
jgi:polysaccharide export outer membrane protein